MGSQGSKPQQKPAEGSAAANSAAVTPATPPTKPILGTTAAAGTKPAESAPEAAVPAAPIDTPLSSPTEGAKDTGSDLGGPHAPETHTHTETHKHNTEFTSQVSHLDQYHDAPEEFAGDAHDLEGKGEGEIGALAGSGPQTGTSTHPEVDALAGSSPKIGTGIHSEALDKSAPAAESARAAPRLPGSEGEIVADGAPATALPSVAGPESIESDHKVSGAGCFPCFAPSSGKKKKDKSAAKAGAAPPSMPDEGEPVDAAAKGAPIGAAVLGGAGVGAGVGAAAAVAASHKGGQQAEGHSDPLAVHDEHLRETEGDAAKVAEQSDLGEHAPEANSVASAAGEPGEWTQTDVPAGTILAAAQTPVAVTDNPTFEEAELAEPPAPSLAEKAAEPVPEAVAEEALTPAAPPPSKIPKPPVPVAEAEEPLEGRSVPPAAPAMTEAEPLEAVKEVEPLEASGPASHALADTHEGEESALRSPAQAETPILEENPVYEEHDLAREHADVFGAEQEAKPLAEDAAAVDPISEDWALVEALPETPHGLAGGQERAPLNAAAAEHPLHEEQAGLVAVPLESEAPEEEPIKEEKPRKKRGGIFSCFFPQPSEAPPVITDAAPQSSPPVDTSPAAEAASAGAGGMSTGAAVATGAAAGGAAAGLFAIPFISKRKVKKEDKEAKPPAEEAREASPAVEARPESFTSQKSLRSQRSVESLSSKRSDSRALAAVAKPTKPAKRGKVDYSALVLEKQKSQKLREGYNTATGLYDAPATTVMPGAYSPMRAMQPQLEQTLARRASIDRTPIKEQRSKRKVAGASGRSRPGDKKSEGTPPKAPSSTKGSSQFRPMSSGPLPPPQAPKSQFRPMSNRVA